MLIVAAMTFLVGAVLTTATVLGPTSTPARTAGLASQHPAHGVTPGSCSSGQQCSPAVPFNGTVPVPQTVAFGFLAVGAALVATRKRWSGRLVRHAVPLGDWPALFRPPIAG
jgi:hypothetical protein